MFPVPVRKTKYLGCFGFNDSPEALGEPAGIWHFENMRDLWHAFGISEALNEAFDTLGEATYSRIAMATDEDGYILFHLLILSVKFISLTHETEAIELTKQWLAEHNIDWRLPESEWQIENVTIAPPIELPF
jgi:hypothetical protein